MSTDPDMQPRVPQLWGEAGFYFTEHDTLAMAIAPLMRQEFTPDGLRKIINEHQDATSESANLKRQLHYAVKDNYASDMIKQLEARANKADSEGQWQMAAAYRDAAGIMRRVL